METLTFSPEAWKMTYCRAYVKGISPGEYVRRALAVYRFLRLEQKKGNKILIHHPDGKEEQLIIL